MTTKAALDAARNSGWKLPLFLPVRARPKTLLSPIWPIGWARGS